MPRLQQCGLVFLHDALHLAQFRPSEACDALQPHRIQPELGLIVAALDMYMGRFGSIPGVEEQPVRPKGDVRRLPAS
jgi:hypothetical protein